MTFNAGYPVWIDGAFYTAAQLREYEGGVTVQDTGTVDTTNPAGGVYPNDGTELQVTAPVSGLTVNVGAGYCAVPHTGTGTGVYRFGLLQTASLTVASNSTGNPRVDLVVANVQDLETTGSAAQVEYITGSTTAPSVPSNSAVLAQVTVPNGATNIVTGDITDMRSWVVPPGGILPITNTGTAPIVPTGQLMYDLATEQLIYSPYTVVSEVLTGSGTWTCPNGTAVISVQAWGAGGGGDSLVTGAGGAGAGEYAAEPTLAVTTGQTYHYSCGSGGPDGVGGGVTTFTGAATTVVANGGQMVPSQASGGAGGTGSTNTIHFNGGAGGSGVASSNGYSGSGGGGGAAGSASGAGAAGANATSGSPGVGGAAAGSGGGGGNGSTRSGADGGTPGGGGGAGGGVSLGYSGGTGGSGRIILNYIVAPGPSPYALAPAQEVWFARNGYTGVVTTAYNPYYYEYYYETITGPSGQATILSLIMTADGTSNYAIQAAVGDLVAPFESTPAVLLIAVDGIQRDAIYVKATNGSKTNCNWSWYTSGAQGTTLSKGQHTITVAAASLYGFEVQVMGPAVLRVARSLT